MTIKKFINETINQEENNHGRYLVVEGNVYNEKMIDAYFYEDHKLEKDIPENILNKEIKHVAQWIEYGRGDYRLYI